MIRKIGNKVHCLVKKERRRLLVDHGKKEGRIEMDLDFQQGFAVLFNFCPPWVFLL
jgi:hypothetical protein